MREVSPFRAQDVAELMGQTMGAPSWHARQTLAEQFAQARGGFTVRRSGRIIACCGAMERHGGHASLWAFYAAGLTMADWAWLLRATRHFIATLPHARIDAGVEAGDARARRWAERCGLRFDVTMRRAGENGGDLAIYWRET